LALLVFVIDELHAVEVPGQNVIGFRRWCWCESHEKLVRVVHRALALSREQTTLIFIP